MSIRKNIPAYEQMLAACDGKIEFTRADVLRLTVMMVPEDPNPPNLAALNPAERAWWNHIWKSKPNVDAFSHFEICLCEMLIRIMEKCKEPWPQNGREETLDYAANMAAKMWKVNLSQDSRFN